METKNSYAERLGPMSLLFSSIFDANQYLYLPNASLFVAVVVYHRWSNLFNSNSLDLCRNGHNVFAELFQVYSEK
jgi:hypothetical protein